MLYGLCPNCGFQLEPGEWFTEEEEEVRHGIRIKTGRKRLALAYLICPSCGHKETIDDTFDKPWHY